MTSERPISAPDSASQSGADSTLVKDSGQTIGQLIDRLGVPPRPVSQMWCDQLRFAAIEYQAARKTLPAIDLDQWSVLEQGELAYADQIYPCVSESQLRQLRRISLSETHCQRIAAFQAALFSRTNSSEFSDCADSSEGLDKQQGVHRSPETAIEAQPQSFESRETLTSIQEVIAAEPSATSENPRKSHQSKPNIKTLLLISVVAVVAIAAAFLRFLPSSNTPLADGQFAGESQKRFLDDAELANPMSNDPPRDATQDDGHDSPSESLPDAVAVNGPMQLQTFDAGESDWENSGDIEVNGSDSLLATDAMSIDVTDFLTPRNDNNEQRAAGEVPFDQQTLPGEQAASDTDELLDRDELLAPTSANHSNAPEQAFEEKALPAEEPQPTRVAMVEGLSLPAITDTSTESELPSITTQDLELQFPLAVALELSGDDSGSGYLVSDRRDQSAIARLRQQDNRLIFTWLADSKSNSLANMLHHGRLRDRSGNTVYLRPRIEADPWFMRFDDSDFQPSWDLAHAIPASRVRLSVELDLPEEVEHAWIEPLDPESTRRARGLAVVSMKDDEDVKLAILLEPKCTQNLSCRIRFAGRLDPMLAWQPFTVDRLNRTANGLLQGTDATQQQLSQIGAVYSRADTQQRRRLRPQRDALETQLEYLTEMSSRLAQLQVLVANLQDRAAIRFAVTISWPATPMDSATEQSVLQMTQPSK